MWKPVRAIALFGILLSICTLFVVLSSDAFALQSVDPSRDSVRSVTTGEALNWAGYIAQDGPYSEVAGTWIVPTVQPADVLSADATWVGIGGVHTRDLIQAGTEAIATKDGSVAYQAWYETLPHSSRSVPLEISPGDKVSVSLREGSPGIWTIEFVNHTSGKTYALTRYYESSHASAEWIQELPAARSDEVYLDDFGSVQFLSGFATGGGKEQDLTEMDLSSVRMVNSLGETLAFPSLIHSDGSFSVARTQSQASPLTIGRSVREIPAQERVAFAGSPGQEFRIGPFTIAVYSF